MPSLVDLDASENNIERVINFYNVRKIETLNLKSNKIERLTKWVESKRKKKEKEDKLFPRIKKELSESGKQSNYGSS